MTSSETFCGMWMTDHTAYKEGLDQNEVKQNAKQKMGRMLEEAQFWLQHAYGGVSSQLFWVEIQGILCFPVAISLGPRGSCPV